MAAGRIVAGGRECLRSGGMVRKKAATATNTRNKRRSRRCWFNCTGYIGGETFKVHSIDSSKRRKNIFNKKIQISQ